MAGARAPSVAPAAAAGDDRGVMALDPDDPPPPPKPGPRNLETLSIAELEAYIGELETEIARTRQTIAKKRAIRGGADALFKR